MDKKITELTAAGALTGTEDVEVIQSGANVKTTTQDIANLGGGGGHVIEEEGTPLTQRANLNFVGAGVTATDAVGKTVVTIPGLTGAQDLFITAPAMWPKFTNGCQFPLPFEIGGTATMQSLDFDQSTDENAQFQVVLPRNWNNGTITFTVYWTATSGSGTVQFEISGVAFSNDDPLSGAFGTAVVIDDTLIATSDLHISPTSSAMTIAGTPQDGDFLLFNIMRDVSDDTLNADAKVLGVRATLTLDASTSE